MDQAQIKALAAIQPFVVEATTTKSPTPRYLADLIVRATSATGTYVFTELLQTPVIQALRAPDTPENVKSHLTLLEIFSWGTYEEYKSTPNLPALSPSQEEKLRQLSLLTLASPFAPPTTDSQLSYNSLLSALSLPTPSALESLVTTSIYAGLLTARLSPTSSPPTVHITSVAPLRDLRPQSLSALLSILQTWETRCTSVVTDLEGQINAIRTNATRRNSLEKRRQDIVDNAVASLEKSNDKTDLSGRALRSGGTRGPNKRELDEQMEGADPGDISSDDARMVDIDDGIDVSGVPGRGGSVMAARGAKRNRGRDLEFSNAMGGPWISRTSDE